MSDQNPTSLEALAAAMRAERNTVEVSRERGPGVGSTRLREDIPTDYDSQECLSPLEISI